MIDYSVYRMTPRERRDYYTVSLIALGFTGYLFYHSLLAAGLLCLLSLPLQRLYLAYLKKRRGRALLEGFRDFLYSISASIAAGRQMPQAIASAAEEIKAAYGEESDIARELGHIAGLIESSHADPAQLLRDFAERSGLEDIAAFSAAYSVCLRSGGDIEAVCIKSAELLLDKIEFREAADALIAEKKLDIAILGLMPHGILFFLNVSSYEYIELLYSGAKGRLLMSFALVLIGTALTAGIRITEIEL